METYELRYFLAVATTENLHKAAKNLMISPGSLSKAIRRLEDELGVKLFERVGQRIRLSSEGRILRARAQKIIELEAAARIELQGGSAGFQVRITGPEILLSEIAPRVAKEILANYPQASFSIRSCQELETEQAVSKGAAHLGLTTEEVSSAFQVKNLCDVEFQTCVGKTHLLYKYAKSGETIPVDEIMKHSFVCPEQAFLGSVEKRQSGDGWRDDKFPRKIGYIVNSLKVLEQLVCDGKALAYLPDYYVERIPVKALKISGCPYSCKQTVKMIAYHPKQSLWLSRLF